MVYWLDKASVKIVHTHWNRLLCISLLVPLASTDWSSCWGRPSASRAITGLLIPPRDIGCSSESSDFWALHFIVDFFSFKSCFKKIRSFNCLILFSTQLSLISKLFWAFFFENIEQSIVFFTYLYQLVIFRFRFGRFKIIRSALRGISFLVGLGNRGIIWKFVWF